MIALYVLGKVHGKKVQVPGKVPGKKVTGKKVPGKQIPEKKNLEKGTW